MEDANINVNGDNNARQGQNEIADSGIDERVDVKEQAGEDVDRNDGRDEQPSQVGRDDSEQANQQPELHLVGEANGDNNSEGNNEEITNEQIIEAILFSSDNPVSASKLASIIGILGSREIRKLISHLNESYSRMGASFRIEEIAGGYQMMTRPEFAPYLQKLYKVRAENKLSAAALETLAVIAYKQPVVRAEVEAIRGVACGEIIRSLLEKGLIKIVGRAEDLGRPMLYGTTKRFLQVFGLASLDDLPKVPEFSMPDSGKGEDVSVQGAESDSKSEGKSDIDGDNISRGDGDKGESSRDDISNGGADKDNVDRSKADKDEIRKDDVG